MSIFGKLFDKKPQLPEEDAKAPQPSNDPENDPSLIRVFERYGQELFTTRDEWRKRVLPGTFASSNPGEQILELSLRLVTLLVEHALFCALFIELRLHARGLVTRRLVLAARLSLLLIFLLPLATVTAQIDRPNYFADSSLPTPPQQNSSWIPRKSKLPEEFVTTTTRLFEQGLADPRGCEYREVEVTVGSVMGGAGKIKVHAWVLPAANNSTQRFAVGWNGLVYPTISVGPGADFRQDIIAAVKADEAMREDWKRKRPDWPFYRFRSAGYEGHYLSQESLLPLKASLLLRLGAVELADSVWATWTAGMRADVNNDSVHLKDPYMMLATDWVWALFDRAITAHMRGDDNLALLSARALVPIQKTVNDEAEKRGFALAYFGSEVNREGHSFLRFLEPLPLLLADQVRRARERSQGIRRAQVPIDPRADKATRIAALIQNLDQVVAPQLSQPGGVEWNHDPTMTELQRQGEDAVEALLTVLESDTRLTRSVRFSRDFHYDRHLIGAHEAAFAALVAILKTSKFGPLEGYNELKSMAGRRALAAEVRAVFKRYGYSSPVERWYGLLADDSSTAEQWDEAARNIAQPTKYDEVTQAMLPAPRLQGERLREKTGPSVSQLLLRRMNELAKTKNADEWSWFWSVQRSTSLALALAAWDGTHYLDELRQFSEKLKAQYVTDTSLNHYQRAYYQGPMVRLYLKGAENPDAGALREYTDWLQTVNPGETGADMEFIFQPAWHHTDDPVVIGEINRLFGDPNSPWVPIIARYPDAQADTSRLLRTPLLSFEAFRAQVLRGLSDKSVVGTLNPRAAGLEGDYDLKVENATAAAFAGSPNSTSTIVSIDPKDPQAPPRPLQPVRLRTCDVYAWKLRVIEGAPQLNVYWPEAQRDAAVEAVAAFLRDHKGPFVNRFWRMTGMEY